MKPSNQIVLRQFKGEPLDLFAMRAWSELCSKMPDHRARAAAEWIHTTTWQMHRVSGGSPTEDPEGYPVEPER